MTLDAMHWVWKHSQSKGNARLALLAVADQARTSACEVRMSHADFMAALNASKSVAKAAVRTAAESGELEVLELGKGTRSSLYRLPKAVGYFRPTGASGPESGPLDTDLDHASGLDSDPLAESSGPKSGPLRDQGQNASGPDSGPVGAASGPESGPHYPTTPSQPVEGWLGVDDSIPVNCRPLVDGMTASGLSVRWPFQANQWFPIEALIKKCGIPALIDHAHKSSASARSPVLSAKYFLTGWRELPPLPAAGTPIQPARPHLRAVSNSSPEERGIF